MDSLRRTVLIACLLAPLFGMGCGTAPDTSEATDTADTSAASKPPAMQASEDSATTEAAELAVLMGRMQRYTEKLGYSVQGKNPPLVGFYLDKIGAVYEQVAEIEMYDGMPIAHPAGVILKPALPPLRASVEAGNWEESWGYYTMLVNACNRCHTATTRQYIEILPVEGDPPYAQRFGVD